jgi:hypothetical protein
MRVNNSLIVFAGTVLFLLAVRCYQEGILELYHIFRTLISNSYTAKPALKGIPSGHKTCFFLISSFTFYFCYVLPILPALYFHYIFLYIYFLLSFSLHSLYFFITPVHSLAESELNFVLSTTGCSFSETFQ